MQALGKSKIVESSIPSFSRLLCYQCRTPTGPHQPTSVPAQRKHPPSPHPAWSTPTNETTFVQPPWISPSGRCARCVGEREADETQAGGPPASWRSVQKLPSARTPSALTLREPCSYLVRSTSSCPSSLFPESPSTPRAQAVNLMSPWVSSRGRVDALCSLARFCVSERARGGAGERAQAVPFRTCSC